ncbi:MAG: hypothetical protein H0T80_18690 [Betaproteobacteria bacterium]|nr:hypothetical protein [Betaproteobacteria bacterium]
MHDDSRELWESQLEIARRSIFGGKLCLARSCCSQAKRCKRVRVRRRNSQRVSKDARFMATPQMLWIQTLGPQLGDVNDGAIWIRQLHCVATPLAHCFHVP